jgi:hypothetical protein
MLTLNFWQYLKKVFMSRDLGASGSVAKDYINCQLDPQGNCQTGLAGYE